MDINIEKIINDLPAELKEKAKACKSIEEFNTLVAENDIEIPTDALESVSGGCGTSSKKNVEVCNKCNTTLTDVPSGVPKPSGKSKYCPKCKKVLISADWHIEKR